MVIVYGNLKGKKKGYCVERKGLDPMHDQDHLNKGYRKN